MAKQGLTEAQVKEAVKLYRDEKQSIHQIWGKLKSSHGKVRAALVEAGVKLNAASTRMKKAWATPEFRKAHTTDEKPAKAAPKAKKATKPKAVKAAPKTKKAAAPGPALPAPPARSAGAQRRGA